MKAKEISAAWKSGDKAAARAAIQEMNAKTTRKHEAKRSGKWIKGGAR